MVGTLPLSSAHALTARQYEAASKLRMNAAKLLDPTSQTN
jgi:hypothetical protein